MTTSEGKSARDKLNDAFIDAYLKCDSHVIDDLKHRFDDYLAGVLKYEVQRESRLSIAAALEMAAQRVLSMWHHSYAKEIAQAIRDFTDADVAHARAEHDLAVREKALEEAAKLAETYCERHASSMHVVNPKRIAEELRALASATEETRQAASPENSGGTEEPSER